MNELPVSRSGQPAHRFSLQAAGLALLGVVAVLVGLGCYEPRRQVGRNSDGSRLELRGVTYAPQHTWIDGNLFQRVLAQAPGKLPAAGAYRGSFPAGNRHSNWPLLLWFRTQRPSLGQCAWTDSHGCRINGSVEYFTMQIIPSEVPHTPPLPGGPKSVPIRWACAPMVVPRGGSEPLLFSVFAADEQKACASFRVPPPPSGPAPPGWKGAAPPLSVTEGDTTFTLTELRHLPPGKRPWGRTEASFRFSGTGEYSREWRPVSVWVMDVNGNRLYDTDYGHESIPTTEFDALCMREPAWKLRVRFARPDPMAVPPDAVWTWRDVPAPAIKEQGRPRRVFRRGATRIALEELNAVNFYTYRGLGGAKGLIAQMGLLVDAPAGLHLRLMRITDQDGRNVPLHGEDRVWEAGAVYHEQLKQSQWSGHLHYRAGTRRLNFTFALWETRTVEYMVNP